LSLIIRITIIFEQGGFILYKQTDLIVTFVELSVSSHSTVDVSFKRTVCWCWHHWIVNNDWHSVFLKPALLQWHGIRRTFNSFEVTSNVNSTAAKNRLTIWRLSCWKTGKFGTVLFSYSSSRKICLQNVLI